MSSIDFALTFLVKTGEKESISDDLCTKKTEKKYISRGVSF